MHHVSRFCRTKALRSLLADTSAKHFLVFFFFCLFLSFFFLFVYLGAGGSDVDEALGGAEIGPEDGVVHVPASCLVSGSLVLRHALVLHAFFCQKIESAPRARLLFSFSV